MNLKRIVRYLKGAPSAKSLIEISDWAGQATTCKSTSGGVLQWVKCNTHSMVKNTANSKLSSAEEELYALTTGVAEGMVTKHLCKSWVMK